MLDFTTETESQYQLQQQLTDTAANEVKDSPKAEAKRKQF